MYDDPGASTVTRGLELHVLHAEVTMLCELIEARAAAFDFSDAGPLLFRLSEALRAYGPYAEAGLTQVRHYEICSRARAASLNLYMRWSPRS
ncbi:MAG: hypothetical protein H0X64_11635 [Gemmatimonadaceae bacterium]|nr:hypothetical protein [Gemmatimonadaceae bacterium]